MYDSMIFDMDGTLVDMVKEITEAWIIICNERNWKLEATPEKIKSLMGLNAHDIGVELFPYVNEEEATKRVETCSIEEVKYFAIHPGKTYIPNEEFLKKLSNNRKLFIVSNCLKGYVEIFFKNYGYENYFIDFRNSSNGKTKGQNIRELVDKYNLKNPVYIGDTMGDYKASIEANVPFIHASYGFGKVDNVTKIKSIEELINY